MAPPKAPSLRKKKLCALLRQVASCFIEHTSGTTAADMHESARLRNEADSLVTLYETGHIDPVSSLENVSYRVESHPPEQESAPLTGVAS